VDKVERTFGRDSSGHRWSGWPGAYCLYCGSEDPREIALGDGIDIEEIVKMPVRPCPMLDQEQDAVDRQMNPEAFA
jgi:hypothetical protein